MFTTAQLSIHIMFYESWYIVWVAMWNTIYWIFLNVSAHLKFDGKFLRREGNRARRATVAFQWTLSSSEFVAVRTVHFNMLKNADVRFENGIPFSVYNTSHRANALRVVFVQSIGLQSSCVQCAYFPVEPNLSTRTPTQLCCWQIKFIWLVMFQVPQRGMATMPMLIEF